MACCPNCALLSLLLHGSPQVQFAGYSVPHPLERKLHVRVQSTNQCTAVDALARATDDLTVTADAIGEEFDRAMQRFGAQANG